MAFAVEQDFPNRENKVYRPQPKPCEGDGPVPEFRRWATRFHAGASAPAAAEEA